MRRDADETHSPLAPGDLPAWHRSPRGRWLAAALALLTAAGLLAPCGARAADEPLVVSVYPGTVDPPSDGTARPVRAWLVARNTGAADLRLRSVTVVGPNPDVTPRVQVRLPSGTGGPRLRPKGTALCPLAVSRRGTGGSADTLLVTYDAGGRTHVATAALTIAPVPAGDLGATLRIVPAADLDPLKEGREGTLTLLLTDRLAVPVTVDALTADAPPGVTAGPLPPPFALAPGQTRPVRLTVSAAHARVGAQTLIVNLSAHWTQDGRALRGSAAVPQPLTVGVVGVSEVMAALGVPLFVLAPGFLLLGTLGLLRRQKAFWYRAKTPGFPVPDADAPTWLSPKEAPDFWIVAILISIVIDVVVALFRPDFFSAYTLAMVIGMYVACLFGGLALYGGWRFRVNRGLAKDDREYGEHRFLGTETPRDVLRKLANCGLGLSARQLGQDPDGGFVVAWQGTDAVIVPQIVVRATIPVDTRQRIQELIDRTRPDIAAILDQLGAAPRMGTDGVVFRDGRRVTVKALDHDPDGKTARIIAVEE